MYYQHSGRFTAAGLSAGLAAGVATAILLGLLYSYAILYIPIVGYVTFLLTGGFALGIGFAAGLTLRLAKTRNPVFGAGITLLAAAAGLYVSWTGWTYAELHRSNINVSFMTLLLHPDGLWLVMKKLNTVGVWTIKSFKPTGVVLWALWGCEAVAVLGIPVWVVASILAEPFCETCQSWCDQKKGVVSLRTTDSLSPGVVSKQEVRMALENKTFDVLSRLGLASDGSSEYERCDLYVCPDCGETNTLSVATIRVQSKKGEREEKENVWLNHLLLSKQDLARFRQVCETMLAQQPAPVVAAVSNASKQL